MTKEFFFTLNVLILIRNLRLPNDIEDNPFNSYSLRLMLLAIKD